MFPKIQIMKAILSISCFCWSLGAGATLIDFDNLPGGGILASGTDLTSQYSSLGVTFEALEGGATQTSVVSDEDYSAWNVTSNIWTNCQSTDCSSGTRAGELIISFAAPVSDVSWLTQSFGSLFVAFNAYDAGGVLLEAVAQSGDLVLTAFTVGGISTIEALQPVDSWAWGLDDLMYTSASATVPAPATLALFGLGLAGLGWARRKKA
jgi:hypothetical protein